MRVRRDPKRTCVSVCLHVRFG